MVSQALRHTWKHAKVTAIQEGKRKYEERETWISFSAAKSNCFYFFFCYCCLVVFMVNVVEARSRHEVRAPEMDGRESKRTQKGDGKKATCAELFLLLSLQDSLRLKQAAKKRRQALNLHSIFRKVIPFFPLKKKNDLSRQADHSSIDVGYLYVHVKIGLA